MPLFYREQDNSSLSLPTAIQTTAQDDDYIFMIDGSSGMPYKITKANLLAGLSSGSSGSSGSSSGGNTSLLMHFDGANNSTTFVDIKGHAVIPSGSPIISTAQARFGGSSLYLDGNSSLTVAQDTSLTFASNPYTFQCWIYLLNYPLSANMMIMGNPLGGESGNAGVFLAINAGNLIFRHWVNGNSNAVSTASVSLNTWHHVAAVVSGTTSNVFLDGTMGTSGIIESNTDSNFQIGIVPGNGGYACNFAGYIDELKVTNGQALYTASFTPPTTAFTS